MKQKIVEKLSGMGRTTFALSLFESERRVRLEKAHALIHLIAVLAGIGVATGLFVPGLNIVISATVFPSSIVAMKSALDKLFDRKFHHISTVVILSNIFGYIIGWLGMIVLANVFPGTNGIVCASVTFITLELFGWRMYFLFDSGVNPLLLSRSEIAMLLRKGELYAEIGKRAEGLDWLDEMPPHVKTQYMNLVKSVEDLALSEEQRELLLEEIEDLLKPHLFSEKGLTEFFAERHP